MRFLPLAHRSAAAHKLHSNRNKDAKILFRGMINPAAGYPPLAYSSPEAVQTTGTVANLSSREKRPDDAGRLVGKCNGHNSCRAPGQ